MANETSTPSGRELVSPRGSNNASTECPLTGEEQVMATHFMVLPGMLMVPLPRPRAIPNLVRSGQIWAWWQCCIACNQKEGECLTAGRLKRADPMLAKMLMVTVPDNVHAQHSRNSQRGYLAWGVL